LVMFLLELVQASNRKEIWDWVSDVMVIGCILKLKASRGLSLLLSFLFCYSYLLSGLCIYFPFKKGMDRCSSWVGFIKLVL
jgi:hypothetical protein